MTIIIKPIVIIRLDIDHKYTWVFTDLRILDCYIHVRASSDSFVK